MEAALLWTMRKSKKHFFGREAFEAAKKAGMQRKRVGFVVEGSGVLRPGVEFLN